MTRIFIAATIVALAGTSASAVPVHFDNNLGITSASGAPGPARASVGGNGGPSAFGMMQSAAARQIATAMSKGLGPIKPLATGNGGPTRAPIAASPSVMPLPGGFALLAGGLGLFLFGGAALRRRRKEG